MVLPSEFSIIFAAEPSIIATAELVVPIKIDCEHAIKNFHTGAKGKTIPKSMPITGPRTFLSASSEYFLTKDELRGVRKRFADRVAEDVARGSCQESTSDNASRPSREIETYSSG
jgi:hypothetical protein